jgi:hypothetical protein
LSADSASITMAAPNTKHTPRCKCHHHRSAWVHLVGVGLLDGGGTVTREPVRF